MIKYILASVLSLSSALALADQASAVCKFNTAQANVIASVAGTPEVLVSNTPAAIGLNPSFTGAPNSPGASVIVRQSIAGLDKANKLRQSAKASCGAAEAAQNLGDFLDAYVINIDGLAAKASLPQIDAALATANKQLAEVQPRLKSGNATVQEYSLLMQQTTELAVKRQAMVMAISKAPVNFDVNNLSAHLENFLELSAEAEGKASAALATHAWDISVGAGHDSGTGSSSAIVTAKLSFGTYGAYSAASDVKVAAKQMLLEQRDGLLYRVHQARKQLDGNLEGELIVVAQAKVQIEQHEKALANLAGINTDVARHVRDGLKLQTIIAKANLTYAQERARLSQAALSKFN